jgi:glycogen debranching enzyme
LPGRVTDPITGEQPGKILHEVRRSDGHAGGTWLPPRYYGTIDATPLWISLLRDARRELSRSGQTDRAGVLAGQILDAAESVGWRLPELYAGFGTDETAAVVAYPAACRPQAWSAASAIAVLQVLLGLTVDVPNRLIRLDPPRPSPVGAITVTGLPVAGEQLDVRIDHTGRVVDISAPANFAVHLPRV